MKHIKSINEYSNSTYDEIAKSARDRGDIKGDDIAKTAMELKKRDEDKDAPNGLEIMPEKSRNNFPFRILEIEKDNEFITFRGSTNYKSNDLDYKVTISLNDYKVEGVVIDGSNWRTLYISRRSARQLAKYINSFAERKVSHNSFKQF